MNINQISSDALEPLVRDFRRAYLSFREANPARADSFFIEGIAVPRQELPPDLISALEQLALVSSGEAHTDSLTSTIRLFPFADLLIATDLLWYQESSPEAGMAMPMHPENQVLIDAIPTCPGPRVLDIGFGSGIFMLVTLQRAAHSAVGLDVSRRARDFALFNLLLNGFSPALCDLRINSSINPLQILEPVRGEQFDLIVCNPPFEVWPTPSAPTHSTASSFHLANGGPDGLEYFRILLPAASEYLTPTGTAHLVFFSVGDEHQPTGILEIAEKVPDSVSVSWLQNSLGLADFIRWNTAGALEYTGPFSRLWCGRIAIRRSGQPSLRTEILPERPNWHWPIHGQTPLGVNPHHLADDVLP